MDWKSRKIEAILEQALLEDKATSDVTTAITVDASLRASATIIAKHDCIVAGLGYLTLIWRPLVHAVYPYNLALAGPGEISLMRTA